MWKRLRIVILLLILAFVGLNAHFDRVYSTDWDIPLRVAVYPINVDRSPSVEQFIGRHAADHSSLERFFAEEAERYGLALEKPVRFTTERALEEAPPTVDPRANMLAIMWWSLRARFWAWRVPHAGPTPDVKMFVLYYDPQNASSLPHSTGQQKGLYAIVHAFGGANERGGNDVVIAHELLHTLGATDKYDPRTNLPAVPEGLAEPDAQPVYPQHYAELMGGRIAISANEAVMPADLDEVVVGELTAREIGWSGE